MQSENSIAFQRDPLQYLLDLADRPMSTLEHLPSGNGRHFLITDPAVARSVLKAPESLIDKGELVRKWRPLLGNSFLSLTGDEHRRRRTALHGQLSKGVTGRYVPEMQAAINELVAALARETAFDAHALAAPLALNLSCIAMFGYQVMTQGDRTALVEAVHLIEDDLAQAMLGSDEVDREKRREREERRRQGRALLSMVVERVRARGRSSSLLRTLDSLGLSRQDAEDEIVTLLVAGHHTAGTAGAWLLYHLASDPMLACRVADEANEISRFAGEATAQTLKRAPVSQALVYEVLRLYPSAWWFAREMLERAEIGGRRLSVGDALIISPWLFQRDKQWWSDPHRLRLDRDYSGPAYMPFGAGPRVCIGMTLALLELQLMALSFAAAFEMSLPTGFSAGRPTASVTLIPPPLKIEISVRSGAAARSAGARAMVERHEHA